MSAPGFLTDVGSNGVPRVLRSFDVFLLMVVWALCVNLPLVSLRMNASYVHVFKVTFAGCLQ